MTISNHDLKTAQQIGEILSLVRVQGDQITDIKKSIKELPCDRNQPVINACSKCLDTKSNIRTIIVKKMAETVYTAVIALIVGGMAAMGFKQ